MASNMMGDVSIYIQLEGAVTYGAVESALIDAGFEDYTIVRQPNTGKTDVQITVRTLPDEYGINPPMPAGDTLAALGEAVAAIDATYPVSS